MTSAAKIREQLGLSDTDAHWYDTWEAVAEPETPVVLPDPQTLKHLLIDRLSVDPVDAAAAEAARPDPEADPQLWWVMERCHQQLVTGMGEPGMLLWPAIPESWGVKGHFIYLYALMATLPATLEYHRKIGVDEATSWATLANLSEKLRLNRARYGRPGLAVAFWFTLHFRGALYQLGRLEFAVERLPANHPFTGHHAGELTLGVHIPGDGGPMTPQACGESIERSREFFPRHFGERFATPVLYTCTSWLLDPQLREFLSPDSNIAAFQDRFTLAPPSPTATQDGRKDVLLFVFNQVGEVDAADLPRDSTLRTHLADGLAAGKPWQVRSGHLSG